LLKQLQFVKKTLAWHGHRERNLIKSQTLLESMGFNRKVRLCRKLLTYICLIPALRRHRRPKTVTEKWRFDGPFPWPVTGFIKIIFYPHMVEYLQTCSSSRARTFSIDYKLWALPFY
jgi:hypothetical protein